jgi:hypothetical protein
MKAYSLHRDFQWPILGRTWQKCRNLRPGIFAVCLEEDCRSGKGNAQKSYMRRYLLQTPGVSDGEPASPGSMLRTTRAGLPAAKQFGGIYVVTMPPAPTAEWRPIRTPGKMHTCEPIHT